MYKRSTKDIIGIVFYTGSTVLSFGNETQHRYAIPLSIFF